MKMVKLAVLATLTVFGAATADEVENKMEIKVIVADDTSGAAETVHWTSNNMDFDLQDLEIGETRKLDSESGQAVSVTRSESGYSFDIDGRNVMMPDMGRPGVHMGFSGTEGGHGIMRAHPAEGVTVISSKPLDASVRDSIRSVLISAGNDDEVTFIDGSEDGRHVMIMKRNVEIVH